jgi:hypothetical protein
LIYWVASPLPWDVCKCRGKNGKGQNKKEKEGIAKGKGGREKGGKCEKEKEERGKLRGNWRQSVK